MFTDKHGSKTKSHYSSLLRSETLRSILGSVVDHDKYCIRPTFVWVLLFIRKSVGKEGPFLCPPQSLKPP